VYGYLVLLPLRAGFGFPFTLFLSTAVTVDTTPAGAVLRGGSAAASAIANNAPRIVGARRDHSSKSLAVSASSLARLVARSPFEGTPLVPCSPV
jgi:hypothetical protein